MEKLTFKQYLASKEKLREALEQTPVRYGTYRLRKYCKFPIGETKELKEHVSLKPKHDIIIEWHYEDLNNPTAVSISFDNVNGINSDEKHKLFWTSPRVKKWLLRNTREV